MDVVEEASVVEATAEEKPKLAYLPQNHEIGTISLNENGMWVIKIATWYKHKNQEVLSVCSFSDSRFKYMLKALRQVVNDTFKPKYLYEFRKHFKDEPVKESQNDSVTAESQPDSSTGL